MPALSSSTGAVVEIADPLDPRFYFASSPCDVCDASDGQSGPTGLMARAESLAGFAVKIFVKEHKVAPVRVVDEARVVAVARAASAGVGEKDAGEA
jgi:hypothetical protein